MRPDETSVPPEDRITDQTVADTDNLDPGSIALWISQATAWIPELGNPKVTLALGSGSFTFKQPDGSRVTVQIISG
jgi:hypothetical protein